MVAYLTVEPTYATMYAHLVIIFINAAWCACFAEYEMFHGFDVTNTTDGQTASVTANSVIFTTNAPNDTTRQVTESATEYDISNVTLQLPTFNCSEHEKPMNIGPYEVPTQRDLVLIIKKTLVRMFDSYHRKALAFLKDIKQVTRATAELEKSCQSESKTTYKKCVRHVSKQCEMITKNLVMSLERQRHDVDALTQSNLCNITSMKTDPVELIKVLAVEEASLEFALLGFLRLLGGCSVYCSKSPITRSLLKPVRHMTDQDLVIKHFLTRKNYIQLIKET